MNKDEIVSQALTELEHSRNSCSDEKPVNWYTTMGRGGYPRCKRCALLKAYEDTEFLESLTVSRTVEYHVQLPSEDG
jgi:hypothetical protein